MLSQIFIESIFFVIRPAISCLINNFTPWRIEFSFFNLFLPLKTVNLFYFNFILLILWSLPLERPSQRKFSVSTLKLPIPSVVSTNKWQSYELYATCGGLNVSWIIKKKSSFSFMLYIFGKCRYLLREKTTLIEKKKWKWFC
jgi:hypothetical protein